MDGRSSSCKAVVDCLDDGDGADRISRLPDSLLAEIISFLPFDHGVRTSVLSKQWRHIWSSIPRLRFDFYGTCFCYSVDLIDKNIALFEASNIKKFSLTNFNTNSICVLCYFYSYSYTSRVDSLLHFVIRNGVEDVTLHCCDNYTLPESFYTNWWLTKLSLRACNIVPETSVISWKSLKSLSIQSPAFVILDGIQKILSGCPALECLELFDYPCYGEILDITSFSLRKLVMNQSQPDQQMKLTISAPNLRSLELSGSTLLEISAANLRSLGLSGSTLLKISAPNLRSLDLSGGTFRLTEIQFPAYTTIDFIPLAQGSRETLVSLDRVESLTIRVRFMEGLAKLEQKGLGSLMRKYVTLEVPITNPQFFIGVRILLKSLPNLETLVLKMVDIDSEKKCSSVESHWASSVKRILKFSLLHLKTVMIYDFVDSYFLVLIVRFILKNAKVLEKMVIKAERTYWDHPRSLHRLAQNLTSLSKSSPHVELIFD